jgi:hemoglobin-like flavoprotein
MVIEIEPELSAPVGQSAQPGAPPYSPAMTSRPSEASVREARASLGRCIKSPAFLDRFYELFMASSEEIRKKFESTDFARQKKMLQDSLFVMLVAAGTTSGPAHRELEKLAVRHGRNQLGIEPEWYDIWLRSLLQAVVEHDPEYRAELAAAWRESLQEGIDMMRSRYSTSEGGSR